MLTMYVGPPPDASSLVNPNPNIDNNIDNNINNNNNNNMNENSDNRSYFTYPHIPTPSVTTFNACSLSAYATTGELLVRKHRHERALKDLKNNDIITLNEIRLKHKEEKQKINYINHMMGRDWECLINGKVATLINPKIRRHYITQHISLIKGRVSLTTFTPKSPIHNAPFNVINAYLESQSGSVPKCLMINKLLEVLKDTPLTGHVMLAGDLNLILHADDSTSGGSNVSPNVRAAWEKVTNLLGIQEVDQPAHTYYEPKSTLEEGYSSKLDRIFISHSQTDCALMDPVASVVASRHSILGNRVKNPGALRRSLSDHVPVEVKFKNTAPPGLQDPHIPRWIAAMPEFETAVQEIKSVWSMPDAALEENEEVSSILFKAAKTVGRMVKMGKAKITSSLGITNILLKFIRLMNAKRRDIPQIQALQGRHENLSQFLRLDSVAEARAELDRIFAEDADFRVLDDNAKYAIKGFMNVAKELKTILPSCRPKINGLRRSVNEELIEDIEEMGEIAEEYWGGVWGCDQDGTNLIYKYLHDYCKQINPLMNPKRPTLELIKKVIMNTNNSSAGPDGIPFAAYRAIGHDYAGTIQRMILALGSDDQVTIPDGFNHGLLFLLPKKGTGVASDTRPITVTNACNRIIAKVIVECITPALESLLEPSQKGFIPGRDGGDHIRELNEDFYGTVEGAGQSRRYHVLFLDTAKAFDSVRHKYLNILMKKVGLPQWVCTTVERLLTDVKAIPFFGKKTAARIDILRGVKQGCPLSPLLFALCYDPLLWKLSKIEGIKARAYADDIYIGACDSKNLNTAMLEFQAFEPVSGLTQNIAKTKIISTHKHSCEQDIKLSIWKEVEVVPSHSYLGILFGVDVTLKDIYAGQITKMEDRVSKFLPIARKLPRVKRHLIFNIFVFTLLEYLMNFYPIPFNIEGWSIINKIRRMAMRITTRFNGTAYVYFNLIASSDCFGVRPHIRDAWATSMAKAAARADLGVWEGVDKISYDPKKGNSMRIINLDYINGADFAAIDIQNKGSFVSADFSGSKGRKTRLIYKRLIEIAYSEEQNSDIHTKLERRGLNSSPSLIQALNDHFNSAKKVFKGFSNIQSDIIHNALCTSHRFLATQNTTSEQRLAEAADCYFCGGRLDAVVHIYGECEVVRLARHIYSNLIDIDLSLDTLNAESFFASSALNFTHISHNSSNAIIIFNAACWILRKSYFIVSDLTDIFTAASKIAYKAHQDFKNHKKKKKNKKKKEKKDDEMKEDVIIEDNEIADMPENDDMNANINPADHEINNNNDNNNDIDNINNSDLNNNLSNDNSNINLANINEVDLINSPNEASPRANNVFNSPIYSPNYNESIYNLDNLINLNNDNNNIIYRADVDNSVDIIPLGEGRFHDRPP